MRALMWFRSDLRVQDNTALHHAVLSARTFCTFMREFSPLGLRADRVEEELSPIDTRTAAGAIWSPSTPVFLLGDIMRRVALRDIA
jgi:hypothetical protein